jgi:hypothetical protein
MTQLLTNAYPDYNWKVYKFGKLPEFYWDNVTHQKVNISDPPPRNKFTIKKYFQTSPRATNPH